MSKMISRPEAACVRRGFPGGDWLAVDLVEHRLPGWGSSLHQRFAAVLVLAGEGVYRDQLGGTHALGPGRVFHHLPGVRHRIQRYRPTAWRQLVLRASPGAWEALATFADPPTSLVWQAGPGAASALLNLREVLGDRSCPGWLVLARTAEALAQLAPAIADPWDAAVAALQSDRQRRVDLVGMAEALGMSYSHFRRGFRQRYGVSPGAWRRVRRLAEAERLMDAGSRGSDAARATGWGSAAALGKARRLAAAGRGGQALR